MLGAKVLKKKIKFIKVCCRKCFYQITKSVKENVWDRLFFVSVVAFKTELMLFWCGLFPSRIREKRLITAHQRSGEGYVFSRVCPLVLLFALRGAGQYTCPRPGPQLRSRLYRASPASPRHVQTCSVLNRDCQKAGRWYLTETFTSEVLMSKLEYRKWQIIFFSVLHCTTENVKTSESLKKKLFLN